MNAASLARILLCAAPFCAALLAGSARAQRARVYASNPVRTPAREWLALASPPLGSSLENERIRVRSCVDRGRIVSLALGTAELSIRACGLAALARKNSAGDFSAPPLDVPAATDATRSQPDAFAEISAYHHVSRALSFFQQLGFAGLPERLSVVVSARIPAGLREGDRARLADTASPLEPLGGAFYLGKEPLAALFGSGGPVLVLGQGSARDFAYDGDIIAHEVAHAVLRSAPAASELAGDGSGLERAALLEGLADYFAAALTGDPLIAEYASGEVPGGLGTRSLESRARCPESFTGDPHGDGQLSSTVLWAARQALPAVERSGFDAAVLRSALQLGSTPEGGLSSFFLALRARLGTELPGALPMLRQALLARGLSDEAGFGCAPLRELSPGQSLSGSGGPFVAPGAGQPGLLQLVLRPPPGARQLTLRMLGAERKAPALAELAPAALSASLAGLAPFAPRLLGRYGRPLRWARAGGGPASDAELEAPFTASGRYWEASLSLPAEAGSGLYLQIVNTGGEGWYDVLTLRYTLEPAPSSPEGSASGCSLPHRSRRAGWLLLVLLALALRRRSAQSGATQRLTSLLQSKPSLQSD